jgi:Ser/Thr protein kinase RdoA (MazF antagonist)
MASQAEQLAELVTVGEAGLAAGLPRQLTHSDFWDDNVSFRGEALVFVADFGFLAERAASMTWLTLNYADTEFGLTGRDRIAALRPLVRGYTIGPGSPHTPAEHQALPWAIARQWLPHPGGRRATPAPVVETAGPVQQPPGRSRQAIHSGLLTTSSQNLGRHQKPERSPRGRVGGHQDLPADGCEAGVVAITERERSLCRPP